LKDDLIHVFRNFHGHKLFEKSLNDNFIALNLVLKKLGSLELKDFGPISLMGSVYKILAKVIVII
jgi:hypothetical protein